MQDRDIVAILKTNTKLYVAYRMASLHVTLAVFIFIDVFLRYVPKRRDSYTGVRNFRKTTRFWGHPVLIRYFGCRSAIVHVSFESVAAMIQMKIAYFSVR